MGKDFKDGFWLFGVPLPFVRPGCPHPGPLPLSGRGDTSVVDGGSSWCFGVGGVCGWGARDW